MTYTLYYYLSGENYKRDFYAVDTLNLFDTCTEFILTQSGNPDCCFELKDIEGNVIFTNENTNK